MTSRVISRRHFTVAEYAELTGRKPDTVRKSLREGRLRGRKVGTGRGSWRVAASELLDTGRG